MNDININKIIINTLKYLNIPTKYRSYSGKEDTYITFFEINNFDDNYSDDRNETNVHSLQIDLWTKSDPTDLKNKIRKALKEAFYDVTYTDLYETDTKVYHIAFRCYFYEEE